MYCILKISHSDSLMYFPFFFLKIFETNVKATFMLCKEIVPLMEKRG